MYIVPKIVASTMISMLNMTLTKIPVRFYFKFKQPNTDIYLLSPIKEEYYYTLSNKRSKSLFTLSRHSDKLLKKV